MKNKNEDSLNLIKDYLKKWSTNHTKFQKINNSPITKSLEPLSEKLSIISELLHNSIQNKKLTNEDEIKGNTLLNRLKEPCQDVELVILDSLNNLIVFCKNNYSNK